MLKVNISIITHAHTHTHMHVLFKCKCKFFGCHTRLAPVPLKRIKRLLPSYPFLCQKSETWTLQMTLARSWSRLWGSCSMATSLRMRGGTDKNKKRLQHISWFHIIIICHYPFLQVCDKAPGRSGILCLCRTKQWPRGAVCGHFNTQQRETETYEGTEHPCTGQLKSDIFQNIYCLTVIRRLLQFFITVSVLADLRYPEGSFHRSGWRSDVEVRRFRRPAICSL